MPRKLPLIGHLPIVRQFQVLGVLLVTFLVFAALMMFLDVRTAAQAAAAAATATEMQMLSQRLARGTALASQGQAGGVRRGEGQPRALQGRPRRAAARRHGQGRQRSTSCRTTTLHKLLQDIKARWDRVDVERRAAARQPAAPDVAREGRSTTINQGNKQLVELAQQARAVGRAAASLREIEYANQLAVLSQRIAKNANALASSDEIDPEVAFLLGKDAGTFRDILSGLAEGQRRAARCAGARSEDARATLTELAKRFDRLRRRRQRDPAEHDPAGRRQAGGARHQQRGRAAAHRHDQARRDLRGQRQVARCRCGRRSSSRCSRSARCCCWARCSSTTRACARSRASSENKRNQEAILRLLNEMGNLADGDLTVQASVTEDVTGAIADSINFTIEELRTLVRGINSATDQVTKATQDAQAISNRLYEASQRQNREIQQASGVGAADGAVDQRGVADRRAVGAASRSSRWPPPRRARSRCRTRSPA